MRVISRDSSKAEIVRLVKECLTDLYDNDKQILNRNFGRGVCERAIVFRFAHYLQSRTTYYVDCDFNSSFEVGIGSDGKPFYRNRQGKPIEDPDGKIVNRFVDVIVHKRVVGTDNDLICFEIKKWNNTNRAQYEKDLNNLHILTSKYGYSYGFHITIHKEKTRSVWTIFHDGEPIETNVPIFV